MEGGEGTQDRDPGVRGHVGLDAEGKPEKGAEGGGRRGAARARASHLSIDRKERFRGQGEGMKGGQ